MELVQRIEAVTEKKMELWPTDAEEIAMLRERVDEAGRVATNEMKDQSGGRGSARKRKRDKDNQGGGRDDRDRDDDVVEAGVPRKRKSKGRR